MINNIIDPKTIRKINRDDGNLGPGLRQVLIYDGVKAVNVISTRITFGMQASLELYQ